jgi:hypothetical protein
MRLGLGNSQKAKRFRKFVTRSSTKFDGTDDFVQFALPTVFNAIGSNDFSVSLWINSDDLAKYATYTRLFEAAYDTNNFAQFNIAEAGKPRFNVFDGGTHYAVAVNSVLNTGQWYHMVGVWDASENAAKLYLDGVLQSGGNGGNLDAGWGGVQNGFLGCRGGAGGFMDGSLDEVAIFSSALTAREVDALYNNGQPTKIRTNPNLAHWFRMGEGKLDGKSDGDSNLLFDQGPNGGLSSELTIANPYDSSGWTTYGNTVSNPSTNSIRVARGASGGSNSALQASLASGGILTGNVTVGKTYRLKFDFETDETSGTIALARFYDGSSYTTLQTGSGSVNYLFTAANAGLALGAIELSPNQYVQFSNISFKEVQNVGTINGAVIKDESTAESVPKKTQNLPSAGSAKSMAFDATDEFVDTGFQPDFIHTDATISFWCNMANFSGFQALGCYSSGKQFYVGFNGTAAGFALQATGKSSTDISAHITAGLWHHIALVADGGTATYYVDGVARDTHSYTPAASANPDTNFYIGAIPDGSGGRTYHMEGSVSEVAVWDAALDGDAIKALYNAGEPTPVATKTGAYDIYRDNLKAYYKMGDATNPAADGTSSRVDSHLFDQTNPGLGAELSVADPYTTGRWGGLGTNTPTFVAGESVRIDRPASGGSSSGGYVYITDDAIGFLTEDLVATKVYKLTLLFETDDSNALVQVTGGGGHHQSSAGSGVKTFYMFGLSGAPYMTFANLDNGKFLKVSQLSVKPVNGNTGTISGATIQTEAPKQIYALPPVANTKSIILEGDDEFLQTQVDATLATRYYSFWAKATRTTDNPVFDHGDTTVGSFIFNQSSGKPLLYTSAGNWRYWNDTSAQDDGLWHHWTVYFDSADINNSKLWCDGVEQTVQATSAGTPSAYSTGIRIGRGGSVYFEGSLDEFSIHEELDEEAIRALFNRGRPIDISKSQGAYDLSDKALHYWRMGDATSPAADGTNDIIFQGLEAEDSELITGFTNGSTYPFDTLVTSGRDITSAIETSGNLGAAVSNSFSIRTGEVYKVTFNLDYISGTNTVNVGLRSDATGANVNLSNIYNTNTNGVNEVLLTATGEDSTAHLQFQLGGYSNSVNFSATDISVKRLRGQYIGPELFKADADLYKDATWFSYNANEETFPNGTAARFFRPTSGGSDAGGKTNLCAGTGTHALTTNLETGCVYKLQFDFLTDDSDAFPRYYDGSSYTSLPSGSGTKVFYFVYSGSTNTMLNVNDLSADKFVQFSNLSLTKVGGAAVMTNMTTSDLQLDTPY